MSNTISIYNFKGGVGKTTTTLNLGLQWSHHFKVLMIDCDPQCNLSNVLNKAGTISNSFYDNVKQLLHDQTPKITPVEINPYLHLISGDYRMVDIESNNQFITFGSEIIYKFFSNIRKDYDLILMDCPTNFGVLVRSILINTNSILIPSLPDTFSLTGVQTLMRYLTSIESSKPINILGIFFNMYRSNTIQNTKMFELAKNLFGNIILNTKVRSSIKVREATSQGLSIANYQPNNPVAKDYNDLCNELISQLFAIKTLDSHEIKQKLKSIDI